MFDPNDGISYLLSIPSVHKREEEFEKRTEEMDAMSDIVNVYVLCAKEIKKKSRSNGLDIAIRLYMEYRDQKTSENTQAGKAPGERTLENNWAKLKPASVFRYLYTHQNREDQLFSPPLLGSDDFAKKLLMMADLQNITNLIRANDYVASRLNADFDLRLPIIDIPPTRFELHYDEAYRQELLALLG